MSDDSFEMTSCLKTARSALDQNLIESNDYDQVKAAFLRAQQIRAGLDAGFIRQDDYDQIKQTFLQSLGGLSVSPSSAVQQHPQPSAGKGDEHPSAPSSAPATAPQASQSGRQTNRQPSFTQTASFNSHSHAPAPAAPSGPVTAGGAHIPADIPKMGGNRPKQPQGTSMSGIAVTEDAVNLYYYMKAKSVVRANCCSAALSLKLASMPSNHDMSSLQYRWALWKLNDAGNEVVIAGVGAKDSPLSELLGLLPNTDCRYGVYDYQFVNSDGCIFNKLIFLNWAPDTARIKAKMMYASTKDFFKGHLDGLSIELQANEHDDITEEAIGESVKSVITRQ
ncbi:TPA: hypothetical protein ACH3X2_006469 [Trebouxia sp. C0005]|nr:MAG: actin-depolymerizing factor [Trebouxia sp. A1-2]